MSHELHELMILSDVGGFVLRLCVELPPGVALKDFAELGGLDAANYVIFLDMETETLEYRVEESNYQEAKIGMVAFLCQQWGIDINDPETRKLFEVEEE
ncbi:hypothetical protein H6G00_01940 [Leptolyngbya sp. FACHB-541]|uniref:hypothetical protein n=1 Tax=Leptolyngbya sp. FACHB-541 TaxID=2692810 RepID=UPI00168906A9|nr:hypothetical protein [Leptolyngbya sp. FACHB-541]MBD1995393.1 hypothetical protein [Leptolyngbya sp. FACHB-541]